MKEAIIALVDWGAPTDLRDSLIEILNSLPDGELHLSLGDYDPCILDIPFEATTDAPDVIGCLLPDSPISELTDCLGFLRSAGSRIPLIAICAERDPRELFELLRLGVGDFILPPLKAADILPRVWRQIEHRRQASTVKHSLKTQLGMQQLVGESPVFLAEISKIPVAAKCDASILITGETGTGKELCARALHYLSPRARKPFVPINCGAIPVELVENELFGHESGAFTGATTARTGLIEEAIGGTLFFDEVDCLPSSAQVKLLRFLQEKEYRPLGSAKARQADVRVIAATNTDLESALRTGGLRRDLFYRLNIVTLSLPPLRERKEDIPLLANHMLAKYATEFKKPIAGFALGAMHRLMAHDWPGNIRELEHLIHRTVVLSNDTMVHADELELPVAGGNRKTGSFQEAKTRMVEQFERTYIQELLANCNGNITKAAEAAQKNRRAFWQLIRKYGINAESFRPHQPMA